MNRLLRFSCALLACIILATTMSGCGSPRTQKSSDASDLFVGSWKLTQIIISGEVQILDDGSEIIFVEDGTFYDAENYIEDEVESFFEITSWKNITDERLLFTNTSGEQFAVNYEFDDDILRLDFSEYYNGRAAYAYFSRGVVLQENGFVNNGSFESEGVFVGSGNYSNEYGEITVEVSIDESLNIVDVNILSNTLPDNMQTFLAELKALMVYWNTTAVDTLGSDQVVEYYGREQEWIGFVCAATEAYCVAFAKAHGISDYDENKPISGVWKVSTASGSATVCYIFSKDGSVWWSNISDMISDSRDLSDVGNYTYDASKEILIMGDTEESSEVKLDWIDEDSFEIIRAVMSEEEDGTSYDPFVTAVRITY